MMLPEQRADCVECEYDLLPGLSPTRVILSAGRLDVLCSQCNLWNCMQNVFNTLPPPPLQLD